jgi:hypothetical protein
VASRTQIVCLHEGKKGRSIDPLFIRTLIKRLNPTWIRPWKGNNVIRTVDCKGRQSLILQLPNEIKAAEGAGGNTTTMVWADVDDDMDSPETLKNAFWIECQKAEIPRSSFDRVVFIFAKDRLENWIEFLNTNRTNESLEGPRVQDSEAVEAAKKLADICLKGASIPNIPPSLSWSCQNWRSLKNRMG